MGKILRKLGIGIVKFIMTFALGFLLASFLVPDIGNMLRNVTSGIYDYASPDAQQSIIGNLGEACGEFQARGLSSDFAKLCENKTLEHEKICMGTEEQDSMFSIIGKMEVVCSEYNSEKIGGKDFFLKAVEISFGTGQIKLPEEGIGAALNKIYAFMNNRLLHVIIVLLSGIALYFLAGDKKLFAIELTGIFFRIGLFIMLPYFFILAYSHFVGLDTTPFVSLLFDGAQGFEPKSIVSLLLVALLKTYTNLILLIGGLFLAVGIVGKVYWIAEKRRMGKTI